MMLIDLDKYAICHSQAYNYAILKAYLCPDSFSFSEGIVSTLGFHLFAYIKDKNKHNFTKKNPFSKVPLQQFFQLSLIVFSK